MAPQRVLLVDDQPTALDILRSGLLHAWPACRVDVAGNAAQARPLIAHNRYDAIITDYFLGDGTGLQLAQMARTRLPEAAIVLVSASHYALAGAEADARDAGIDLLPKPLDLGRLVRAVDSGLKVMP